jgi:pyridoxine 4-dehydrogenase
VTFTASSSQPVTSSGTFRLGGERDIHRLGFGAMQLTGTGVWGEPADRDGCIRTVRRAVDLGVDFIDTADSYGPAISEEILREAIHPYRGVTIATKAGLVRTGPGEWHPVGRPAYLRQQAELSLRRLGVDCLDLFQLHRIDPEVPAEDQFAELSRLQKDGKVRHVGLSEVSVEDIERARGIVEIATVQNLYNLTERKSEKVLDHCAENGIGFVPWFPIANGDLARPGGPVDTVARETGGSPAQVALAWLLARSPVMLPIPGTAKAAHVEENCAAAELQLTPEQVATLTDAA